MRKYVFKAGLFEPRRKVTVRAENLEEAKEKAKTLLDKRTGDTAPVAWDLELVKDTTMSMWDSSSVTAMERTAREQADGTCSKKIVDRWLEVWYDDAQNSFLYEYHDKVITRDDAVRMHPGGAGK